MSEIKRFYAGKNILVTGSTGFIGKVMVEKILRDCDEINSIYLIIRRGRSSFKQRCKDYLNHLVFDNIRQNNPKQLDKVKFLSGDVTYDDLALSNDDLQEIYDRVHIVLHSAANVRFDLQIWEALNTNTLGTYRLLEIAKRIKHLEVFVYVSTAYSQSYLDVTDECHYKSQIDTFTLVNACKRFDENVMVALQTKLLGDFPNTYSLSKHLAEDLVYQYRNDFAICVVRPSVVTNANQDPIPGYCEGLNGFFGLGVGIGRGVVRTFYLEKESIVLVVPVDVVANAVITTSWLHGTKKKDQIEYYNGSTDFTEDVTFTDYCNILKENRYKIAFNFALWHPNGSFTRCVYHHYVRLVLFQILPAIFVDILLKLFGQRPIMVKVQRKIISLGKSFTPYLRPEIRFTTDRFASIGDHQNRIDKKIFDTHIRQVNKVSTLIKGGRGVRKFLLNEKDEDLPRAVIVMKLLYSLNMIAQSLILYYAVKFIWKRYSNHLQF